MTAGLFLLVAAVEVVNYVLILAGFAEGTAAVLSVFKDYPKIFLLVCVFAFLIIGLALDSGPACCCWRRCCCPSHAAWASTPVN